jgi:hypothetical protein
MNTRYIKKDFTVRIISVHISAGNFLVKNFVAKKPATNSEKPSA